jgi:membrane protease YdiL (CAAX protease family)
MKDHTIAESDNAIPQLPRNWSLGEGLILWILSVILIFIVPAIAVIPVAILTPSAKGVDLSENKLAIVVSIFAIFPAHLLTMFIAWLLVKKHSTFGFFETIGWRWGKVGPGASVLLTVAFLSLAAIVATVAPPEDNDFLKILRSSQFALVAVAFVAVVSAPIVEEVVYRGILFPALKKSHGTFFSILAVTALFALVHVPQYWPSYTTIGIILSLSLFLTIIRNWTDSLLPCFAIHLIFNSLQVVSLLIYPEQISGK